MSESDEQITVGAVSEGGEGRVDLPVVELLTGRGFVTGKSGSGKSNTASVVAEKLLDRGLSLLIVDIDGEYYGLKEEYEILHVGNDEECDIQVSPEHAGKIAELALEKHVPIILDVSSFLDESEAKELLTEVARQLFAKEKKKKQPFLLVVEEIHEWLPEGGGLDECGRMLIKVAKRGRKHGLGMCGISQRPADVKKDFITQCDWLVWHRLTWGNDTKVVQRILGSDYADWVEDLNDGEGFLMTDWDEEVRQVQFQRKRTFDAGATPGLDDFERPELKSVSGDLVSDLEEITEEKQARQNRIREMERKLKDKDERIEELETELEEARDLSNMAEQFARAMMAHATGRAFREDITGYQAELEEERWNGDRPTERSEAIEAGMGRDQKERAASTSDESGQSGEGDADSAGILPDDAARPWPDFDGPMSTDDVASGPAESWDGVEESDGEQADGAADHGESVEASGDEESGILEPTAEEQGTNSGSDSESESEFESESEADTDTGSEILIPGADDTSDDTNDPAPSTEPTGSDNGGDSGGTSDIIVPGDDGDETPETADSTAPTDTSSSDKRTSGTSDIIIPGEDSVSTENGTEAADETATEQSTASETSAESSSSQTGGRTNGQVEAADGEGTAQEGNEHTQETLNGDGDESDTTAGFRPVSERESSTASTEPADWEDEDPYERPIVASLREEIAEMDPVTRGMLAYYRERGPASPLDAHVAAGGDGDRPTAYGRNRTLRETGLVAHAGRGRYGYALPTKLDEAHDGRLSEEALEAAVERVEGEFRERADAPWPTA